MKKRCKRAFLSKSARRNRKTLPAHPYFWTGAGAPKPSQSYISMEIIDQGIGIPKEEYNQIFQRFYRGSHPLVKQTEGSGVGLYLTRRIIEEQGGTVSVKSAAGQGSVFVVRLPL